MRESIFFASIRSFFVAFFGIVGISVGIIFLIAVIGGATTTSESEKETVYTAEILPNASGIRKELSKDAPVILRINVKGIIGTDHLNTQAIRTQLTESREGFFKDERVKAILLYIQTPGGTVTDADGIYRAIKEYKEQHKVPVFAYVDGMCASGGMYVAAAADKIISSDVSLIGSIGVISPSFVNISQLIEKIGVQSLTLYAGKGKDDLNPMRPWKSGEEENFKHIIDYYYDYFVDIITTNRPQIDKITLVKEYGANVFPAKLAKQYGFIDETENNLNDAIKKLATHIGIKDDYYQMVQLKKKTWYTEIFDGSNALLTGKIKHELSLPYEMNPQLMNQFLYLYKP